MLGDDGLCIPSDFISNEENIEAFCKKFYADNLPRVVICGINPGRYGACKTGIPFLDYCSLSKLLTGIDRQDKERSAEFFLKVIQQYGAVNFFQTFYVTNISSVGYSSEGRNFNYNDLSASALEVVEKNFLFEMDIVQPTHVIALGKVVQQTLVKLLPKSVDCTIRLPHPSWIAAYRSKEMDKWLAFYMSVLGNFMNTSDAGK
jgi:uracil-DNA glycosylase